MLQRLGRLTYNKNVFQLSPASRYNVKRYTSKVHDHWHITQDELDEYNKDGCFLKRGLFDQEEIDILHKTIANDKLLQDAEYGLSDGEGGKASLVIWNYLSNDTYGNFLQSKRMIDIVIKLLNVNSSSDVLHYHSKLNRKHAKTGGAFIWHQDYGYWYQNGLIYPNLVTSFIAVDECNRNNGILEILKGTHLMGRIDHEMLGGQNTVLDYERMNYIQEKCEKVAYELNPGDTMFFHCNVLHKSDQNKSDKSRNALLGCYNNINNLPYKESHHYCTPINVASDDDIKKYGSVVTQNKDIFLNPSIDETVRLD